MQQTNQIIKLTIAEPEQFVRFFKFYQKCNNNTEITLNFEKDRLHFREMNLSNTLMTNITIKDSLFTEFYAEKGKKDISMPDFLSFLKRANKEDLMQLEFNDTKYNVILKSSITRTFTGNLINFEKTEHKLPELAQYTAKLSIDASILYNFLKDFKKEDRIEISAIKDKLRLRVFDYEPKQIGITEIESIGGITENPSKSVYSFELFKNSISNKLTEKIHLSLGNNYPLKIEYTNNNYNVMVIIAPITDDKEMPKEDTIKATDKTYYKAPEKEPVVNDVGINPMPVEVVVKDNPIKKIEIKHSRKSPEIQWKNKPKQKKGKLDLDALGFNENFKCPNCKDMISFYFFIDKFSTRVGTIKDAIEQDYNADQDFAEFVFESSFNEDLSKEIERIVKARLKEMFKKFKRGG